MSWRPELHTHTNFSDGALSPGELLARAEAANVNLLAITDHDCIAGACSVSGTAKVRLLPGVEISTGLQREIHLLGYGVSSAMGGLADFLEDMQRQRVGRAAEMMARLAALGMPLDSDALLAAHPKTPGRAHIAQAMQAAGYITSVSEAFEKWLSPGCPAYVERKRLSVGEAIRLLRDEGAVPVLAHPGLYAFTQTEFLPLLDSWQADGLMGVEVFHPGNAGWWRQGLETQCRQRGLLVAGGSDFHNDRDSRALPGSMLSEWLSADADAQALLDALSYLQR